VARLRGRECKGTDRRLGWRNIFVIFGAFFGASFRTWGGAESCVDFRVGLITDHRVALKTDSFEDSLEIVGKRLDELGRGYAGLAGTCWPANRPANGGATTGGWGAAGGGLLGF